MKVKISPNLRRALIGLVGASLILLIWSISSPLGSDPDSSFHGNSIWCGQGIRRGVCESPSKNAPPTKPTTVLTPASIASLGSCFSFNAAQSAACEADLLANNRLVPNQFNNQDRLYPNGYYWVMSHFAFLGTEAGLMTVRLINVALFMALTSLLLLLARSHPGLVRGVFTSIVITWVPLGLFLIASYNSSSWTITGVTFFWAFLWIGLRDRNLGNSILAWSGALLSGLIAIGSRFDGAVYVALSAVIVIFISWRERGGLPQTILAIGTCVIAICAASLSYLMTGQGVVVSRGLIGTDNVQYGSLQVFWTNLFRLPGLFLGLYGLHGFGGGLGWLDTPMPPITWTLLLVCASITIMTISRNLSTRHKIGVAILIMAVVAIPLYILQNDKAIVGEYVQSRYVLPLVTVLIGVLLVPGAQGGRCVVAISRRFRWSIALGVTVAHGAALHTNMRRYISGLDVVSPNLNEGREWWPTWAPNPNLCWLAASTLTLVVVLAILEIGVTTPDQKGPQERPGTLVENSNRGRGGT